MNSDTVKGRVNAGWLLPVAEGVYSVGRENSSDEAAWVAAVLAGGPDAYLARRSAGALWGLLKCKFPIEVVRSESRSPKSGRLGPPGLLRAGRFQVIRSRNLNPVFLTVRNGIPVTSCARTILDLAAVLDESRLKAVFNEADRMGLLRTDDLTNCFAASRGRRGASRFRRLVESRHPEIALTRSELEAMFLEICRDNDLPMPEVNTRVGRFEVDCLWRSHRLIVELDGFEYHRGRMAFLKDAERDKELRRAKYNVHRFTYEMVKYGPGELVDLLRAELDRPQTKVGEIVA